MERPVELSLSEYESISLDAEYLRRTHFAGSRYFTVVAQQISSLLGIINAEGLGAVHDGIAWATGSRVFNIEHATAAENLICSDRLDTTTCKDVQ